MIWTNVMGGAVATGLACGVRSRLVLVASIPLAIAVLAGCGESRRPSVLLITIDTLRADRLGCYGFGLAHTPAIDRLADEGVRCTDAATVAPITLPAHSSIMTGLYPPAHGVRDNGNFALGDEAVTLAERLRESGYDTAAFVSALVLARRFRLDQGFDLYDDDLWAEDEPPLFMIRDRPARKTADRVLTWLEEWKARGDRPFFVWTHFFDPHQPHKIEDVGLAALAPTSYDAEVAQADQGVGRLLDWLRTAGVLDHTLVVLTADHGESLGQHGEQTHGIFVYDATIRVPLVWRLPGVLPAGRTYDGPVRATDVVPTVLGVLGLPGGDATQGENLLAAFQGRVPAPELSQYVEAELAEEGFGMAPLFGVRRGGLKWIRAPRPELYDLRADPGETRNLAESGSGDRALDAELDRILADSERRQLIAPTRQIDRETEEMLRALGYLAAPEQRAEMAGMDPKDGMVLYAKLEDARHRAQLEDWAGATALLRELIAVAPGNVTARNILALAAVRQGKLDEAEREYEASLAQQPRQHRVHAALAALALQRGRVDEAERRYLETLALAPSFVEAMATLGFIHAQRGDEPGAQAWYEKAIAADPTYPHAHRRLADLFYARKDYPRALTYYDRTLDVLPRDFVALVQAGNSARFIGDPKTAAARYEEARAARPDSWIPPYNLACLRALDGRPEDALSFLNDALRAGFASPRLLEENEDFAVIRGTPAWDALLAEARVAAERKEAPRPADGASS